jgi:tRNA 2-selenouridine synthase
VTGSQLLENIFLNDTPLIDVRAEVEFVQGAFPGAVNIPVLTDEERRLVGIRYKDSGPDEAEKLGHELVSGQQKEARINSWIRFLDLNPGAPLYCFRGGRRSQIACEWLQDAGRDITRIPGGYKAMRRFLLTRFDQLPAMIIVSGKTGVGKTILLSQLTCSLDLERHANHRGSAFGRRIRQQPSQIDFENRIAIDLLKFGNSHPLSNLFLEDEGRLIGRLQLPPQLQAAMKQAPIILLQDEIENRVDRIYEEYIVSQWQEYSKQFQENAFEAFSEYLCKAMLAIHKRLGGLAYTRIKALLDAALAEQKAGNPEHHKYWIFSLLKNYYDPMYSYQLDQKADRIVYRGTMRALREWAEQPGNRNYG